MEDPKVAHNSLQVALITGHWLSGWYQNEKEPHHNNKRNLTKDVFSKNLSSAISAI